MILTPLFEVTISRRTSDKKYSRGETVGYRKLVKVVAIGVDQRLHLLRS